MISPTGMQLTGSLLADSIIAHADRRTSFLANFWPQASAGAPPARAAAVDPETKVCPSQLCDYPWEGFWNAFSSCIYKIMPTQLLGKLKTLTDRVSFKYDCVAVAKPGTMEMNAL